MEKDLARKGLPEEIEIIELDERLDLAADPLLWLAEAQHNCKSCAGCGCPTS
jgi:hypothetical protein